MQLENTFTVPVPVDQAWEALLDVERIAPCMPGAVITERSDDEFHGRLRLKVGPITAAYAGVATLTDVDPVARTATIVAAGKEQRGSGTVAATIRPRLDDVGDATRVTVVTELEISGKVAQFGRSVIADVSSRICDQFAANLAAELQSGPRAASTFDARLASPTEERPSPVEAQQLPPAHPASSDVSTSTELDLGRVLLAGRAGYAAVALVSFLAGVTLGRAWRCRK